MKVVLLSCGSAKLDHKAKAKDLYTGNLFKSSLKYAKCLKPDHIFILSALYGVVELDDEIEPYDVTLSYIAPSKRTPGLKVLDRHEKEEWANKVIWQLSKKTDLQKDDFTILAGSEYISPIRDNITNVNLPLEGLRQGERLNFLNNNMCE